MNKEEALQILDQIFDKFNKRFEKFYKKDDQNVDD